MHAACCAVLYCTVLYCTVLYCTVLYCIVLYCTVLYCTVLYCTVLYCTVLCCTVCISLLFSMYIYLPICQYSWSDYLPISIHLVYVLSDKPVWLTEWVQWWCGVISRLHHPSLSFKKRPFLLSLLWLHTIPYYTILCHPFPSHPIPSPYKERAPKSFF